MLWKIIFHGNRQQMDRVCFQHKDNRYRLIRSLAPNPKIMVEWSDRGVYGWFGLSLFWNLFFYYKEQEARKDFIVLRAAVRDNDYFASA